MPFSTTSHPYEESMKERLVNKTKFGDLADRLSCIICYDIPLNPLQCTKCSTLFCDLCIYQSLENSNKCPHCRQPDPSLKLLDRIIAGLLSEMIFQCKYHSQGCLSQKNYEMIIKHEASCSQRWQQCERKQVPKDFSEQRVRDYERDLEELNNQMENKSKEMLELQVQLMSCDNQLQFAMKQLSIWEYKHLLIEDKYLQSEYKCGQLNKMCQGQAFEISDLKNELYKVAQDVKIYSSAFSKLDDEKQRNILGELLYPIILSKVDKSIAPNVTGMLIDPEVLTIDDIIELLKDEQELDKRVEEAKNLLNEARKSF